jgi:hypothetical protein
MKNEFGEQLDKNGYAPSILETEPHCFCCYGNLYLQRHEIFHGPNRKKAKADGLWVNLCPTCHYTVHNTNGELDRKLKKRGQEAAMTVYGWSEEEFRKRYGRNYL